MKLVLERDSSRIVCVICGVAFESRDLSRLDLHEHYFRRADLSRCDLSASDLSDCDFSHADLKGTDMRGANLRGADLRRARLHDARLDGATFDEATRWPDDFDPFAAGAILVPAFLGKAPSPTTAPAVVVPFSVVVPT